VDKLCPIGRFDQVTFFTPRRGEVNGIQFSTPRRGETNQKTFSKPRRGADNYRLFSCNNLWCSWRMWTEVSVSCTKAISTWWMWNRLWSINHLLLLFRKCACFEFGLDVIPAPMIGSSTPWRGELYSIGSSRRGVENVYLIGWSTPWRGRSNETQFVHATAWRTVSDLSAPSRTACRGRSFDNWLSDNYVVPSGGARHIQSRACALPL